MINIKKIADKENLLSYFLTVKRKKERYMAILQEGNYEGISLHNAIQEENIEKIEKFLLETSLQENIETVKCLLKFNQGLEKLGGLLEKLLRLIVSNGKVKILEKLVQIGLDKNLENDKGETMLHWAADLGQVHIIEKLLALGAETNIKDFSGGTALHMVAGVMWIGTREKAEKYLQIAKKLLAYGANPNVRDNYGNTPLHYAVGNGDQEIVEILLDKGSNPDIQDDQGKTALHFAVTQKNFLIIEILLEKKANTKIKDKKGNTAFHIAVKEKSGAEIVKLLLITSWNYNFRESYYEQQETINKKDFAAEDLINNKDFAAEDLINNKDFAANLINNRNIDLNKEKCSLKF